MVVLRDALAIMATGSVSSLGCGTATASAALRARVSGFRRSERFRSLRSGESFTIARAGNVDTEIAWKDRLATLMSTAAESVDVPDGCENPMQAWCVWPPPRQGATDTPQSEAAAAAIRALHDILPLNEVQMVCTAHDGALTALSAIREHLEVAEPRTAMLCAVDSWLDDMLLDWLEENRRIRTRTTAQGMIPGEASGVIVLANSAWVRANTVTPIAAIVGLGGGLEPQPWYTDEPCAATGLSVALHNAFIDCGSPRAGATWCDLNGEPWRVDEWMYAYIRSVANQPEPMNLMHPADRWGDVGAATGALLLSQAAHDIQRSARRGPTLVWCASDMSGARAAAVLAPWSQES